MHSVNDLHTKIESAIAGLSLNSTPAELYEPMRYMLSLGGKRVRPLLVLMGCDIFDGKIDDALNCALGIELFHNFTLLHDDIMDHAPLRRSKQTVHEKWNVNSAILSGDAMFVKSFQMMMLAKTNIVHKVLDVFSRTAIEVCEGQQLDMSFEVQEQISISEYIRMITFKTAVLVGASMKIGAMTANASEINIDKLYEFGKNIGIAFQLQDDMLDVYGDERKFGKQLGGDILSNKKTYLYLKALEVLDGPSKKKLLDFYKKSLNIKPEEKLNSVISIFNSVQINQLAKNEMQRFYQNALQHLSEIQLPDENKKPLLEFCENLMEREI